MAILMDASKQTTRDTLQQRRVTTNDCNTTNEDHAIEHSTNVKSLNKGIYAAYDYPTIGIESKSY